MDQQKYAEAEPLVRDLVDSGELQADELATLLEAQHRTDELEAFWRNRADDGDVSAGLSLAHLLVPLASEGVL